MPASGVCAAVIACTPLPYDPRFEIGVTLAEAIAAVPFNYPDSAKFCALSGGASSRG
jgi:hypothetical protein